jgi:hypothetical protein
MRVFLPANEEQLAGNDLTAATAAPFGNGELILVVDDDAAVRESVLAVLTDRNYRVMGAGNGLEAVSHFTTHLAEIALVITDVDMPYLGGVALARTLMNLRPELPLLVISGLARGQTGGSELEAAKRLTQTFLLKPFTCEALLTTVYQQLHLPDKAH